MKNVLRGLGGLFLAWLLAADPCTAQQSLGPNSGGPPPKSAADARTPPGAPAAGRPDRSLVDDGSFENGECGGGSAWTCTSDTPCNWILNPLSTWGYPAYHGEMVAWLGGYCGVMNSNSFCQEVWLNEPGLRWHWMGYVADTHVSNFVYVKIDGDIVWAKEMTWPEDHTYGTWSTLQASFDLPHGVGLYEVCFEFEATTGANMLIDYVENH